ncbi:predicted protein [Uncinocarpus reesii 1704]|uniref:Uncharacterized protein n=1 Tax=Uncinocarpus reesii (strain UAMH 1704) TaxID=336963 RepID=C4JU04_UNCRE|nr:uncharacterized protein UREG_05943 [Uncinocarpus reesii 1704]EEP81101.1 predicted protein [Uncinocarpus reesii 1704]
MLVACKKQKAEEKKKHDEEAMQAHTHAMMAALEVKVMIHEHNHLAAADLLKDEMEEEMKTFQSHLQASLNEEMLPPSEKMGEEKFEIVVSFDEEEENEEEKDD